MDIMEWNKCLYFYFGDFKIRNSICLRLLFLPTYSKKNVCIYKLMRFFWLKNPSSESKRSVIKDDLHDKKRLLCASWSAIVSTILIQLNNFLPKYIVNWFYYFLISSFFLLATNYTFIKSSNRFAHLVLISMNRLIKLNFIAVINSK